MTAFTSTRALLAAAALVLAAPAPLAFADDTVATDQTASLTLTIAGIEKVSGDLMIAIGKDATGYDGKPTKALTLPVTGNSVSETLSDLEPGEYGIKLYHDVNSNGEMDTNPFGMPVEPFAFSNDAKGRFGPAKWEAAKFTVTAGENTHTITMN